MKHMNMMYSLLLQALQLAPVVQTLDSAIHWINHYPLDNSIGFASVYPLDSDLSAIHHLNNWGLVVIILVV